MVIFVDFIVVVLLFETRKLFFGQIWSKKAKLSVSAEKYVEFNGDINFFGF